MADDKSDWAATGADSESAAARKIVNKYGDVSRTITGGSVNEINTVLDAEKREFNRSIGRRSGYARGGMVKAGSPKVTAPCSDTKTIRCWSK